MGKKRSRSNGRGGGGGGGGGGRSNNGPNGGRPRRRRRGGGGDYGRRRSPGDVEPAENGDAPLEPGAGLLELHPNGYGFLRSPDNNYSRERTDPFVPGTGRISQIPPIFSRWTLAVC